MNKKVASEIAVGVILLIAVIVGGVFWMQSKKQAAISDVRQPVAQTPVVKKEEQPQQQTQLVKQVDETANWQTYRNAKLGFEIKYPKGWSVVENFEKDGKAKGVNNSYLTFEKADGNVGFNFGVGDSQNDYLGQPTYKDESDGHFPIGEITLAKVKLQKIFNYYENDSTSAEISYVTDLKTNSASKINGRDVFIRTWLGGSSNKKYNKTTASNDTDLLEVDKILSTFKFTK